MKHPGNRAGIPKQSFLAKWLFFSDLEECRPVFGQRFLNCGKVTIMEADIKDEVLDLGGEAFMYIGGAPGRRFYSITTKSMNRFLCKQALLVIQALREADFSHKEKSCNCWSWKANKVLTFKTMME